MELLRVFPIIFINIQILTGNTISTERNQPSDYETQTKTCEDEMSSDLCFRILQSSPCRDVDSTVQHGCKRSCGMCNENGPSYQATSEEKDVTAHEGITVDDNSDDPLPKGGCEDKIPQCSNYMSYCCSMKEAMNYSCQKTCRFCSESPATLPPGGPSLGITVPTSTVASNQDPCDPTKPPSATANIPGQTTTTTQSPVGLPTVG